VADTQLSALSAASALTGTELFYSDSGSADVKVTATQIKTFAQVVGAAQTFDFNSSSAVAEWQYAATSANMGLARFSTSGGPKFVLARSRGGSVGTMTVMNDTDSLGDIIWNGADGSAFQAAARIYAAVDGTPGSADMPGRLVFATTRDGLGSTTDRWSINAAGDFYSIGAAGNQNGILCGGGSSATGARYTVETTAGTGTCISQFVSTDSHPAGFFRWDTSAGERPTSIFLARAYSETIGTMTIIPAGHDIGEINFLASDGSTFESAGYIRVVNDDLTGNSSRSDPGGLTESDGAPALTSIPGTIWFATTEAASSSPTRRWAINSVGSLYPHTDNAYNFGKTDCRPAETYLGPVVDCESIDVGATGPILSLYHNSTSPANSDIPGQIEVYGMDSGGAKTLYGELRCIITDVTATLEDSSWALAGIVNGSATDYLTATSTLITTPGSHLAASGTAIPAGGTAGIGYRFSSTSNFGIFFGSGAPSLSAAKGSIYLRSDGSSTTTRAYVNTDGGTTWTNFVTTA
jgi:hypothetical protein